MKLHIVANLDQTLLRTEAPARRLAAIADHLDDTPGIVLTLFTRHPFQRVRKILPDGLGGQPRHLVTDGGDSLFHQGLFGEWEWDSAFPDWLSFHRTLFRRGVAGAGEPPGSLTGQQVDPIAVALDFLEIFWEAPRPLVVFGDPSRDRLLLQVAEIRIPLTPKGANEKPSQHSGVEDLSAQHPDVHRILRLLMGSSPGGRVPMPGVFVQGGPAGLGVS